MSIKDSFTEFRGSLTLFCHSGSSIGKLPQHSLIPPTSAIATPLISIYKCSDSIEKRENISVIPVF
ncbi:MAG: hypothetical protein V7K70_33250 [Nostoc sp.]